MEMEMRMTRTTRGWPEIRTRREWNRRLTTTTTTTRSSTANPKGKQCSNNNYNNNSSNSSSDVCVGSDSGNCAMSVMSLAQKVKSKHKILCLLSAAVCVRVCELPAAFASTQTSVKHAPDHPPHTGRESERESAHAREKRRQRKGEKFECKTFSAIL